MRTIAQHWFKRPNVGDQNCSPVSYFDFRDILVVGVVTDAGCHSYKGKYPVEDGYERYRAIDRIPWVDVVVYQDGTDPSNNLRQFLPDAMTHGDDWDQLKVGHETLHELGIEYITIPYTKGISSTILRQGHG